MRSFFGRVFGYEEEKPVVSQAIDITKTAFDPANPLHIAHVKEAINKLNQAASNLKSEDMKYGGVFMLYLFAHYMMLNSYLALLGYAGIVYAFKEDKLFDRKKQAAAFTAELNSLEKIHDWLNVSTPDPSKPETVKAEIDSEVKAALRPYMQPKFANGKWHYLYNDTCHHLKATADSLFEHAHAIKDNAIMVCYGKEPASEQLKPQLRPM